MSGRDALVGTALPLLARFVRIHQARSQEEREAIYRFRYSIYGRELRRDYPGMDHQRGRLSQEEDERPEARLYYTGSLAAITGTVRARIWDEPPREMAEELSLHLFPRGLRIAYLERLMVRPTSRGGLIMLAICWHAYERLMREGVDLWLLTCVPGLARHYVRLGARPYGARLVEGASAAEVPLVIVMNDIEHARRSRSPFAPQVQRLARPCDPAQLAPLFESEQPVEFDSGRVAADVLAARLALFEGVGEPAVRQVAEAAFLLRVPAGELVVRSGTAEREMYVVLDGELLVDNGVRIGKGETMGEMAFLRTSGLRTATVRAVGASRLLVLRRRFLDDLAKTDLRAAYLIARNLGRIAADRFAEACARAPAA